MKRVAIGLCLSFLGGLHCALPQAERAAALSGVSIPSTTEDAALARRARAIHRSAILIDGHNDLPWVIRARGNSSFDEMDISVRITDTHTDIPRLREGGVGAQFWSAWVPPSTMSEGGGTRIALEQIDLIRRMVKRYPETFEMASTSDDIVRIHKAGKIASLIGVEGGHTIESSLGVLRVFYDLGVRYLTLTHSENVAWADSATDERKHGGLTEFGEQVVREMNRLGMLIDISHVSPDTMRDVLRVSEAPIIASHSSAYAVAKHSRNVPDDVLRAVAGNGGVIMVNFYSGFIHPDGARTMRRIFEIERELQEKYPDEDDYRSAMRNWRTKNPIPRGTVATVVDHIDHIVKVAGIDHVGIGSDYDGVTTLPVGLEDVSCFPALTLELLQRGYSAAEIRKILGANVLRALRAAEKVASRLQHR